MALWPVNVGRIFLRRQPGCVQYFRTGTPLATLSSLAGNRLAPTSGQKGVKPCHLERNYPAAPLLLLSRSCANVSGNLTLPPLMDAPPLMWPKIINTIRNWVFTTFVIRPHMDREFSLTEFDKGARQALSFISNKLSRGEFEELEDLIEPSALAEIKRNIAGFSVAQRELLPVEAEDIFFSFPYEIGIIIPDNQPQAQKEYAEGVKPPQVRHVEITYVFHVLKGMSADQDLHSKTFREFIESDETKRRVMVCNYRFFRDFTAGKDPRWIVNVVNHFLPADLGRR